MRTWGVRMLLGLCLTLGSLVATPSTAGAAEEERAAQRAPSLGWQGYGGARLGMSLRKAARRLDRRVQPAETCTVFRSISVGRGQRTLWFTEQYRREGRVTVIYAGRGTSGPAGVRAGMRLREARQRLERTGVEVGFRRIWNDAYQFWMSYAYAAKGGRVLLMRHDDGRLQSLRTAVNMKVARAAMRDVGGC